MVGAAEVAAGTEDKQGPRQLVLTSKSVESSSSSTTTMTTTVDEEIRPVPVAAPRKLLKNNKASQDAGVSKEMDILLRLLVFKTAVNVYHFLRQPARSWVEEDSSDREENKNSGRELRAQADSYQDYYYGCGPYCDDDATSPPVADSYEDHICSDCLTFFMYTGEIFFSDKREDFCDAVAAFAIHKMLGIAFKSDLVDYCKEIIQCSVSPLSCCELEGMCLDV